MAQGGEVPRADAEALARDWLAAVGAGIALRVLTGDAYEAARFVELCSHVLDVTDQLADEPDASGAEGGAR